MDSRGRRFLHVFLAIAGNFSKLPDEPCRTPRALPVPAAILEALRRGRRQVARPRFGHREPVRLGVCGRALHHERFEAAAPVPLRQRPQGDVRPRLARIAHGYHAHRPVAIGKDEPPGAGAKFERIGIFPRDPRDLRCVLSPLFADGEQREPPLEGAEADQLAGDFFGGLTDGEVSAEGEKRFRARTRGDLRPHQADAPILGARLDGCQQRAARPGGAGGEQVEPGNALVVTVAHHTHHLAHPFGHEECVPRLEQEGDLGRGHGCGGRVGIRFAGEGSPEHGCGGLGVIDGRGPHGDVPHGATPGRGVPVIRRRVMIHGAPGRRLCMIRWFPLMAVALFLAAAPAAFAHDGEDHDDDNGSLTIRMNGPIHIGAGESAGTVVVINDDAIIDGTVRDNLIVVNGDARISGNVGGDVVMVRGDLDLVGEALVEHDVTLINGRVRQQPTATVAGSIERRSGWLIGTGAGVVFGFFLWIWLSVAAIVAGLLFAAVGGRQVNAATAAMIQQPAQSLLAAVIVWFGGAILTGLAFASIVGIGTGLAMLTLLLPSLVLLGYVVAGAWLGRVIFAVINREVDAEHPYLSVFTGIFGLVVAALIPVIGWFIGALAVFWGTGGIGYVAWRAFRSEQAKAEV